MNHRALRRRSKAVPVPCLQAASVLLGAAMLTASVAHGFTADARRLGMGNIQVVGSSELASRNIAFQSMPARDALGGFVVPLPLGLLQLATDFPTFDPEDPDFSATRLVNLAMNPPFFLEMTEPSSLDGDISIFVSRNSFAIDFEDAQRLLPQKPFEVGSVYSAPLVKLGVLGVHAHAGPMMFMDGEVAFDDAFHGVLAHGQPLQPNSVYGTTAGGETMIGTGLSMGWSGPVMTDANGDGLYWGAAIKYVMGFFMAQADTRFSMATGDTIFGSADPLDVDFEATTRRSRSLGNGVGFDVGAGYRIGAIDLGLGFRDLGTQVTWGNTAVDRSWLDEQTNEVITETLDGGSYTQKIPVQTTLNVSWTGNDAVVGADLTTSRLNTSLHLGAEKRVGMFAVRGGLLTDQNADVQLSWGGGVGLSRMWLDLGFQTHNRSFTRERGLTLGTSITFR